MTTLITLIRGAFPFSRALAAFAWQWECRNQDPFLLVEIIERLTVGKTQ